MGPSTVHLHEILHCCGGDMVDRFTNLISGARLDYLGYSLCTTRISYGNSVSGDNSATLPALTLKFTEVGSVYNGHDGV